jgi:hypothetical protein
MKEISLRYCHSLNLMLLLQKSQSLLHMELVEQMIIAQNRYKGLLQS